MGRNKKTYTDEFKLKCIKELLDGKAFSEVCSSNNVAPSTLSDWKKAFLLNGLGNKEVKRLQKLQEETEEKLAAAKAIIGQKELEIDLLKKKEHYTTAFRDFQGREVRTNSWTSFFKLVPEFACIPSGSYNPKMLLSVSYYTM